MEDSKQLAILIISACIGMTAIIIGVTWLTIKYQKKVFQKEKEIEKIEREKQVELFRASVEAEERQKELIAKNLHDSINPMLAVLKYSLSRHQSDLEDNITNIDFEKDKELIDRAIHDIRGVCHDLIPSALYDYGLLKSIHYLFKDLHQPGILETNFESDTSISEINIPLMDQVNVYRICQELINNILKYEQCTLLSIRLKQVENSMYFLFNHNGQGISDIQIEDLSKHGLGLKSVKSRVLILNAGIKYDSNNKEYKIKLELPLT